MINMSINSTSSERNSWYLRIDFFSSLVDCLNIYGECISGYLNFEKKWILELVDPKSRSMHILLGFSTPFFLQSDPPTTKFPPFIHFSLRNTKLTQKLGQYSTLYFHNYIWNSIINVWSWYNIRYIRSFNDKD